MKKLFILFIAIAAFGVSSFAQETGTATVKLISPIAIEKVGGGVINFGTVITGTAGTVSVAGSETATRSASGPLLAGGATGISAAFKVTGTDGYTFTVTLPSSITVVSGELTPLVVNAFTSDVVESGTSALGDTPQFTLSGTTRTFYVGATLHLVGDEVPGTYTSATFPVNVVYN